MPNWKKVIVSGSDAVLRNITASSGITGSIIRAPQIIGSVQVGAPTIAATTSVATNLIEEETANGGIEISANLTASGNISASGNIYANRYYLENNIALSADGTTLGFDGGGQFLSYQYGRTGIDSRPHTFNGIITASAGIHAAAIVSASGFETPLGTVTAFSGAFGDVSASGTILAAKLDAAAVSDTLAAAIVAEIDNDEIPIAKLAEDAVTVTAGTNLSNGGTVTLGGSITLNVDDAFLKNDADDTTSGTITSAGLIATKDTDGGNTTIQIINSNTDGGEDKGAGIEFKHGSALGALSGNQRAGKILATKASGYQGSTTTIDSNLEFYTANNDTDTLQLKIDNTGLAVFTGNISSSAASTGSLGRIEADSFSKTIVTSHHNMSLDGNSATVDYYIPINSLADGSGASLYYTRILPAYNGRVLKILFRPSVAMGSSCIIYMSRRAHDGTSVSHQTSGFQASETFDGSALSTVIVPCAQGGANAANWVFEEGDQLGFSLVKNTTGTTTDLTMTVVYEYDII